MPSLQSASIPCPAPSLLVHGGAWAIPDEACAAHRTALQRVLDLGRSQLQEGGVALEVATAVVALMEADGTFDAGCGAMLNQDGEAELDAGVMDGATLEYGAVMATHHLAQPVRVARRLLKEGEGRVRMLAGEGAERFAEAQGFDLVPNQRLVCDREQERFEAYQDQVDPDHPSGAFLPGAPDAAGGDTVGCVVRDATGRVAAATSTGGTPFKPPGRVGDSPLPGAGFYATAAGAAGATGWGEAIAAVQLSSRAVQAVADGASPEAAARERLTHMHEAVANPEGEGATAGLLLMDGESSGAWAFSTPRMARGGWHAGGEAWVEV